MEQIEIRYDVVISGATARTTLTQVYINPFDTEIETEFSFPIVPHTVFTDFQAELRGRVVRGIIKEKEQAQREYQQHIAEGSVAAYSQLNKDSPDIMSIALGNLPPHEPIKIRFSYSEELEVCVNRFWLYKLPSTITPRYFNAPQSDEAVPSVQAYASMRRIMPQNATYNVELQIIIKDAPERVHSLTHAIEVFPPSVENGDVMVHSFDLLEHFQGGVNTLAKDFVLLYRTRQIGTPTCYLGTSETQQLCAMVTFVPDFANVQIDDAIRMQIEANLKEKNRENATLAEFPVDLDSAHGEFIFLLDRSKSMQGIRLEKAKKALLFFLKSLPQDSLFNVYSFGATFETLFPQSAHYNEKAMQQAMTRIPRFAADKGGTNIYKPLQHIFTNTAQKGMPRHVFLLTDGDVSQPQQVLDLIARYSKWHRLHAIGVGNGASRYLIEQSSKIGRGKHLFVDDSADVQGSIITLLKRVLTPYLDRFTVQYDEALVEATVPAPAKIPFIVKNETFTMFFFFRQGVTREQLRDASVLLKCFDSKLNTNLEYRVNLGQGSMQDNTNLFKLATARVIKLLEEDLCRQGSGQGTTLGDDIFFARQIDAKREIVQLSTQHQVLSTHTAFLCVVEEASDELKQQPKTRIQKIIIPQLKSVDDTLAYQSYHYGQLQNQIISPFIQSNGLECASKQAYYNTIRRVPQNAFKYLQKRSDESGSFLRQKSANNGTVLNLTCTNQPFSNGLQTTSKNSSLLHTDGVQLSKKAQLNSYYNSSSNQQKLCSKQEQTQQNIQQQQIQALYSNSNYRSHYRQAGYLSGQEIQMEEGCANQAYNVAQRDFADLFEVQEEFANVFSDKKHSVVIPQSGLTISQEFMDGDFIQKTSKNDYENSSTKKHTQKSSRQIDQQDHSSKSNFGQKVQEHQNVLSSRESISHWPKKSVQRFTESIGSNSAVKSTISKDKDQKPTSVLQKPSQPALMSVVTQQSLNGSWICTLELLNLLGFTAKTFNTKRPSNAPKNDTVWTTICVLKWLHNNHLNERASWQLIEQKALKWLEKQGITNIDQFQLVF